MSYRELLVGCGLDRKKRILAAGRPTDWHDLTTLDVDPSRNPDVLHDLEVLPLPFADSTFDEVHAYEVLEHTGRQGDYKFFFAQFEEFWRILKPGGVLVGSVPKFDSVHAFADPSHTRVIPHASFGFLNQDTYNVIMPQSNTTNFRGVYRGDFEASIDLKSSPVCTLFVLEARKPSRWRPYDP